MKAFADSSALVKLYVPEVDSDEVETLDTIVVSALCRVEVLSGLWRKSSAGEMESADAELLSRMFEADIFGQSDAVRSISAIPVSAQILERAASLVPIHSLRSLDAIQLASAIFAREADPECRTFACFDTRLAEVFRAVSFGIVGNRVGIGQSTDDRRPLSTQIGGLFPHALRLPKAEASVPIEKAAFATHAEGFS